MSREQNLQMVRGAQHHRVYLCARYSRHQEMQHKRDQLNARGVAVTSRWIDGDHEWVGTPDHEMPLEIGARFAREDLTDLQMADMLVMFGEPPDAEGRMRGGRHVEFGYALSYGIKTILIGPRENVFTALPEVHHFDTWDDYLAWMALYD